ncbi:MAG: hypothetical protein HQK83_10910 [Fibrobacteria bacterium]|nr:hypothetical protein [Fibrobacteria bacterium]
MKTSVFSNQLFGVVIFSLAILFLGACDNVVHFKPNRQTELDYKIYRQTTTSTMLKGQNEIPGTCLQIDLQINAKNNGGNWEWERTFLDLRRNGWNKDLLAGELALKAPLKVSFETSDNRASFVGLDSVYPLLHSIPRDPRITNRLMGSIDTSLYKKEWMDRWNLMHFLQDGDYRPGQNLDIMALNKKLVYLTADSLKINKLVKRGANQCLEYSMYYTRKDSIRLDMEQFFVSYKRILTEIQFDMDAFVTNTPKIGTHIKEGLWKEEKLSGQWRFALNIENAFPCFESRKEQVLLELKDYNIKQKIAVTIFRFSENVYRHN